MSLCGEECLTGRLAEAATSYAGPLLAPCEGNPLWRPAGQTAEPQVKPTTAGAWEGRPVNQLSPFWLLPNPLLLFFF